MPGADESALVVLVPEVELLVAPIRSEFDRSALRGMPAHITVLYPFRAPGNLSSDLLDELRALFSGISRFTFRLCGTCGFPGAIYLAPEPFEPFDALTRTVATRFPDTPPYGGAFTLPVPHLTLAQKPPAPSLTDLASRFLESTNAKLPIQCTATEVTLAIKRAGRWSFGPRFALA